MLSNRAITLDRSDRLVFLYAASTQAAQKTVQVSEISYCSINQTDLAVLKLKATVGQLRAQGIEPIQIQRSPHSSGSPIQVIGAPSPLSTPSAAKPWA